MTIDLELNQKKNGVRPFLRARDTPKPIFALLYGFQQVMVCVSALLTVPFLVTDSLCAGNSSAKLLNELISSTFVGSGLSTIIQTMFGMRLALLQGTAFAYVPSVQVFMGQCTTNHSTYVPEEEYYGRLALMQGCLMASSLVPMLIGFTGVVGVLTKFIGPLTYLIAIVVSWAFCLFLTVCNLVEAGGPARVDIPHKVDAIKNSAWIAVPYPGKFGPPTFNVSLFIAFLLSAMTSVFESVGDYHAAARMSLERAPPSHAINRGILAEGMGSFVSGLLGPAVGMTTHTENIGVIGVTRVASRWTMVVAGILLIILGVCTKIGAILSTVPDPLVGGILASSMAMVVGVAVSNLQTVLLFSTPLTSSFQVDMTLSRNMGILGFSMLFGMIVPEYFRRYPVHTGKSQYILATCHVE
ncbi:putative permease [Ancylostoma duodenale]|uniref:Putative permease n=1 Tax=Ancylostoma duodenale TaxID=51022 RepID=A0A0C2GB72_9BILA|nr:putative permease [Ancylostoma duodenale]